MGMCGEWGTVSIVYNSVIGKPERNAKKIE